MFRAKLYLDLHEEDVFCRVTREAGRPFDALEERIESEQLITFVIDAEQYQDDFYEQMRQAPEVTHIEKRDGGKLLITKQSGGALPIIRANHGKLDGIDKAYGTKRIFDVIVLRRGDLRQMVSDLHAVGDVQLGKITPLTDRSELLSERQQLVVQMALDEGYFEWPREINAAGLAAKLDISHPTMLEHLRKAERKLLEFALRDDIKTSTSRDRQFLSSD